MAEVQLRPWQAGAWKGALIVDDHSMRFVRSFAAVGYGNGLTLAYSIDKKGKIRVTFKSDNFSFQTGSFITVNCSIDASNTVPCPGTAKDTDTVVCDTINNQQFLYDSMHGHSMVVDASEFDQSYNLTLNGSLAALTKMADNAKDFCSSAQVSANGGHQVPVDINNNHFSVSIDIPAVQAAYTSIYDAVNGTLVEN